MSPQQLVGIAIRMFSIVLAVMSIPYLTGIPAALRSHEMEAFASTSLMIGLSFLIFAIIAWFFPMIIAHKLVPKTTFENRFDTRPDEVATVAIAIIGLWSAIHAGPDLVSYLFQASLKAGSNSMFMSLGAEGKADVFFLLLELMIALFFVFKAHKIAKFITKPFSELD